MHHSTNAQLNTKLKQFRIFGKLTILQTMLLLGSLGIAATIVYQLV